MHNCKTTETTLTELVFGEMAANEQERLLEDLQDCPACREQFVSIKSALRAAEDTFRAVLPPEEFWSDYHSRLTQHLKLNCAENRVAVSAFEHRRSLRSRITGLLTASVRVPVPVALGLILLVAVTGGVMLMQRQTVAETSIQSIPPVTQTIEVPVFREQVVTRVVYVRKSPRRSPISSEHPESEQLTSEPTAKAVASLSGFQPTGDVTLTIIKGSSWDEK